MKKNLDAYKIGDFDPYRPHGEAIRVALAFRTKILKGGVEYVDRWKDNHYARLAELDRFLEKHITEYEKERK